VVVVVGRHGGWLMASGRAGGSAAAAVCGLVDGDGGGMSQ
jgi:hypothetical protein